MLIQNLQNNNLNFVSFACFFNRYLAKCFQLILFQHSISIFCRYLNGLQIISYRTSIRSVSSYLYLFFSIALAKQNLLFHFISARSAVARTAKFIYLEKATTTSNNSVSCSKLTFHNHLRNINWRNSSAH